MKFFITALLFVSTTAIANSALFYGIWGSEAQCARTLIIPQGTKHWSPFEISADWLKHGEVWCRIDWVNVVPREEGAYAVAQALCGEDDNRNYRINFNLVGDELTLIWNNEFANSALRRCQ